MAALNSKKNTSSKETASVSNLIVRRSQRKAKAAPMLTEDYVPAGTYHSEIIAVTDAQSDTGKFMVDVTYRLTDDRGKAFEARVRYPAVGYHLDTLCDALIAAGLPEESPLTDSVGTKEELEIIYPFTGALGKIKNRRPASTEKQPLATLQKAKKTAKRPQYDDEDDGVFDEEEFDDDFLEEED